MNFNEKCVKALFETANTIKLGMDMFDEGKPVKAGAILGCQVSLILDFIRTNQEEQSVKNVMAVIEKENKAMKDEIKKMLEKKGPITDLPSGGVRYIG